jgi:hypothetical protein
MYLGEVDGEDVDWVYVAQDRFHWRLLWTRQWNFEIREKGVDMCVASEEDL